MHLIGTSPTLNFERDLQIIDHLDRLGFDEAWIGEHHSGGVETIASPEVTIAAAAQRTRTIKLGCGVNSLPYHHPLVLADRLVQLDHLTRGRLLGGFGPGQLVSDAAMMGIEPKAMRPMMEEALPAIMGLLRGERVDRQTDWFRLVEAELQLKPYSEPLFDCLVAATVSPSGPTAAGKAGCNLLSVGATNPVGFAVLDEHWGILEQTSAANGHPAPDRRGWRLMGPMYLAETEEQALEDTRHGWKWIFTYLAHNVPTGLSAEEMAKISHDDMVAGANANGMAVVGTPEMAIAQIERLMEKTGGFGTFLMMCCDFATQPNMLKSFELFAERVIPHFQGQSAATRRSYDRWIEQSDSLVSQAREAQQAARTDYEAGRTGNSSQ